MYIFNRKNILNKRINDKNFKLLSESIRTNNIDDFKEWEWLGNIFNEVAFYKELGLKKPKKILNSLFKLNEFFNFSGIVYRGCKIKGSKFKLETNDICSWSSKLDTAERFSEDINGEGFNSVIIKSYVENALDLSFLMINLLEKCPNEEIKYSFDAFLGEDEILYPITEFIIIRRPI